MTNNNNLTQEQALRYAQRGWAVFPCHSVINSKCSCGDESCKHIGKHPRTKNGFHDATTNLSQIKLWWSANPNANIGCATGDKSKIVVLDLDAKHNRSSKEFNIPPTPATRSGGGGEHFFFKYPECFIPSSNGKHFGEGVDIKADGGYVILAPSSHESGNSYEWILEPEDIEMSEMPDWLISKIKEGEKTNEKLWQKDPAKVIEGNRNETAASMAGKIRQTLPEELRDIIGWPGLVSWNEKMPKPLDKSELYSVWESVKKYDSNTQTTNPERGNAEKKVMNVLLNDLNITLIHDEQKDAYVYVNIGNHHETLPCKGKIFKRLLSRIAWDKTKESLKSESIKNIINTLEGKACFDGPQITLANRAAWHGEDLWYDLTNEKWQAVKINKAGWNIIDKPPIIFKRYNHNAAQKIPATNGNIKLFLKYINITNSEHQLLFLVYLISCFIPDYPHPMIVIFGAQGSSKSTCSKLTRQIIDPSMIEVAGLPNNLRELIQALAHHYFLFFDNVSHIAEDTSDAFCKAITGSGFTKRELYENDEDVIYKFMRCVGINGINLVTTKSDLLERSLLIELKRINSNNRRSEKELYDSFEKDLPYILGGVFDVLVDALKIKETIKHESLPRMADFAIWGSCIAEALGHTKKEFLDAYDNNIKHQNEMLINENVVATAIITFMEDKNEWKDSPTELMNQLYTHARFVDIDTREKYWPKGAGALSRRLNELSTSLKQIGILVTISTTGTKRYIHISKTPSYNTDTSDDISENVQDPLTF